MGCGGSKQEETVSNPVASGGQTAATAASKKEAKATAAAQSGNSAKNKDNDPNAAALKIQGMIKRKRSAKNAEFANQWKVIY